MSESLPPPHLPKAEEDTLNLRQALSALRRRWWLIFLVGGAVTLAVSFRVFNEVPLYRSQFRLLVEPIAGEASFDQFSQRLIGQLGLELDYDTQVEVLRSPTVMDPIVEKIQEKYPDVDYNGLIGNLGIGRVDSTKILEVSYQDSDPEKIKYILDQVAVGFIDYSQREQKTGKEKGLQFVEEQLPELQNRVDTLQAQVQEFRQEHNLLDPQVQGQKVADRLNQIQQQRQDTQADLKANQALYDKLNSQLEIDLDTAMTVTALSEAPRYQTLLNQLQEIETQIALESARFTDQNPSLQGLRDRKENLMPLIREEAVAVLGEEAQNTEIDDLNTSPNSIRLSLTQNLIDTLNQQQVLTVQENALQEAESRAKAEMQKFAVLNRQYNDLQRRLEVATESLKRFLSVQEDLQIEAAQRTMSWELINNPQLPQYPIAPNTQRGILLAVVAGLLAGAGAALIAEKLDVRFHSPDDLKENLGLPLLGIIPYRKDFKDRKDSLPSFSRRYRASPFVEAFRSLNANLSFFTPDKPLQTLVISSSIPLEGKSTTSANLAQAAAAMGQRVLLVDADLRRPQIHGMTDLPNVWGLSHVISMDIEVEDVIQRSPNDDNLFILTAGQIPPDPTRLLSSQKMRSLIERFRQTFDLVIFDTPPMLGLADAKFLASQVDVMLMVVRLGWTDRTLLKQVLDNIKVSQTSALGLIANGAKDIGGGSYYYYHRYFSSEEEPVGQER
ncbi:polysaccharide biosynthesis tyrosine autokinase [Spirulina sp. CS-785/01]|uniref:GumC family protein n=1 Tax=Spirulina sp. CS-785/01 TaxID=3021716 RepID=UPI00232FC032|nr:polysaccharide biosynthesis tyrosine autokinase [Spirulina sp. CS-785/01]MDB9311907.1 polysaccharide biosynthesis tyrosine autokinase [Spirulina sp. CS-785/01]